MLITYKICIHGNTPWNFGDKTDKNITYSISFDCFMHCRFWCRFTRYELQLIYCILSPLIIIIYSYTFTQLAFKLKLSILKSMHLYNLFHFQFNNQGHTYSNKRLTDQLMDTLPTASVSTMPLRHTQSKLSSSH